MDSIAKDIADISLGMYLTDNPVLPLFDLGKLLEIPLLNTLDFSYNQSYPRGYPARLPEVVCPVAEGFENLVRRVMLGNGRISVVFLRHLDVGLFTLREHGFHFGAIGLPDNNTEVGGVKVYVEKGISGIRDEQFSNIWQAEIIDHG
jgi:hypothetical protein